MPHRPLATPRSRRLIFVLLLFLAFAGGLGSVGAILVQSGEIPISFPDPQLRPGSRTPETDVKVTSSDGQQDPHAWSRTGAEAIRAGEGAAAAPGDKAPRGPAEDLGQLDGATWPKRNARSERSAQTDPSGVLLAAPSRKNADRISPDAMRDVPLTVSSEGALTSELPALLDAAQRQIAEQRLDQPAGNNALETFRRIVTNWPADARVDQLRERLREEFLMLWSDAIATGRSDLRQQYFEVVESLRANSPADIPTSAIREQLLPDEQDPGALASSPRDGLTEPPSAGTDSPDIASVAMQRGDVLMKAGDIVAARRFYEIAASSGIAGAATAIGRTYDPIYMKQVRVRGLLPNADIARQWYEKAAPEDPTARFLLDRLSNQTRPGEPQ